MVSLLGLASLLCLASLLQPPTAIAITQLAHTACRLARTTDPPCQISKTTRVTAATAARGAVTPRPPPAGARRMCQESARGRSRLRDPDLLRPHGRRGAGQPRALRHHPLPAGRLDREPRLRRRAAAAGRLLRRLARHRLCVGLRSLPTGHDPVRLGGRVGRTVPRRGPLVLRLSPGEPPRRLHVGGARRPPPERGVQPLGRAPAELAGSARRVDLLHAVRALRLPAGDVRRRVGRQHALRVLATHARDRAPRPVRVDLQHAVRAPGPPRRRTRATSTRTTRACSSSGTGSSERTSASARSRSSAR